MTSRPSARQRVGSWLRLRPHADAADLPFEHDAGRVVYALPHLFAELLEIGGGGVAGIDEEIRVLLRDHGTAALQAAATGSVDQLPRLGAGRVGEGRTARPRANRLRRLALRLDRHHAPANRIGIAALARKGGGDKDPILGRVGMAIGEAERGGRDAMASAA